MTTSDEHIIEEKEKKNKRRGVVTSVTIHIVLLLLFIFLGLTSAFPPPTEGIMINFGTTETGSGITASEVVTPVEEISPTESTPEPVQEQFKEAVAEEIVTQDIEETPAIETVEEAEPEPEIQPEEIVEEVVTESVVEEIEIEESVEEVVAEQPEEEKEPEVDSRALFTGQQSENNSPSDQGITQGKGDQGVETGNPASDNYNGEISYGLGNTGIGYDLEGRSLLAVPPIEDESQETGTVAIRIKVDRDGNVLYAKYQSKGSTTTNIHLIALAEKAARKAQFSASSYAAEEQFGRIIFTFKLK